MSNDGSRASPKVLPIRGADVSMTAEIEARGAVFRADGVERDLFELLAEHGVNWIRLRLWVDPRDESGEPYMGGTMERDDLKRFICGDRTAAVPVTGDDGVRLDLTA